jgi:hypothetical protein
MRKYEKIEEEMDKRSTIVDRYYAIGEKLFAEPTCQELKITLELGTLSVAQSCHTYENALDIWRDDRNDLSCITLTPELDRDDAFRLAGLLMAWGDSERVHSQSTKSL